MPCVTPEAIERRRRSNATYALKRYRHNLAIVQAAKSGACVDCGRDDLPPEIMHLDHRDSSEKSFTISNRLASRNEQAVRREIAKCDSRCPTCHALRHWREKQEG